MGIGTGLRLSVAAARWGAGFYVRHVVLIAGLSLVPAVQRFAAVRWGEDLPVVAGGLGEVLTAAVRVLLIVLILRLALGRDAVLATMPVEERWRRFGAFIDARLWAFLVQFVVLAAAVVLFDTLPTRLLGLLTEGETREWATTILIAVKNPTVIAFTFVWMAAVAREMILTAPEGDHRAEGGVQA